MRLMTREAEHNLRAIPGRNRSVRGLTGRTPRGALHAQRNYGALRSILGGIYARLGDEVRHGAPALTRSLAPGLALAEDPGHGESYGLHRAMLVAEGLCGNLRRARSGWRRG